MILNMSVEEEKKLKAVTLSYYIVLDNKKKTTLNIQKHIYNERHSDILPALWYCLHLPRSGLDVIPTDPLITIEGNLQHNINLISSNSTEEQLALLREYPPTLFISEDSCYDETKKLSDEYLSYLGCVNISSLDSDLLNEQWSKLGHKVKSIKPDINLLSVTPKLLTKVERSALPITYLTNQTEDTKKVLEILQRDNFDFNLRGIVTQRQIAALNVLKKNFYLGAKVSEKEFLNDIEQTRMATGLPLVITLPGSPSRGGAYGLSRRNAVSSPVEQELINFLGLQRAIARGGIWLEGRPLSNNLFRKLDFLEGHFHEKYPNSKFVWDSLNGFGRKLKKHLGVSNLQDYISGCSHIIAFTDFPIGLAILPGFSDPICSLVPISYYPLTPLADTFRDGIGRQPEHYIGSRRGFKILIVECLDQNDHIRNASDIGWRKVIEDCQKNSLIEVNYQEVGSINDMELLLAETTDVDILVISAHGEYHEKNFAGLSIGEEIWLPDSNLNVPPVVILSACHVAPKGRGAYTVSDAFLKAGALAVLGTLIPVGVRHNALLTQRFFWYISEVLKGNFSSENLAEVLSRVISLNAVHEVLDASKKLREWAYKKNADGKSPIEEYYEKFEFTFGQIHSQTINILKEIAKDTEMESYLESVLQSRGYISESFFYIFSGFPENVIIKSEAIEKMVDSSFVEF